MYEFSEKQGGRIMAMVNESKLDTTNISANTSFRFFLKEYDDVLVGKKKTYSAALMARDNGPAMCAEILRRIFKKYLDWSPFQIRDCLTQEIVERMCLAPFIRRIPSPSEVNRETELYYVAWFLYPETKNVSEAELVCKVYRDLMEGKIQKFPKNYFNDNVGYYRAKILFMTMLNEYFSGYFSDIEHLYRFFAANEGKSAIDKYKLKTPMQERYGNPLDYLHDSLPTSMQTKESEELYRKIRQKKKSLKDSLSVEDIFDIWEKRPEDEDADAEEDIRSTLGRIKKLLASEEPQREGMAVNTPKELELTPEYSVPANNQKRVESDIFF